MCEYSVIIPVYCEQDGLLELTARTAAALAGMGMGNAFEIIFVDDGSIDDTRSLLKTLAATHPYVRTIRLRRNCGKSLALMAGFRAARGKVVITMDGDLQDPPEDIPTLAAKIAEGWDMVNGWRVKRQDQNVRKLGSRFYNMAIRRLSGLNLHDQNCGMKAYRSKVLRSLVVYGQYHRFLPLQAHLAGYKVTEVAIANMGRKYGTSKFQTFRWQGLFDLLSLLFTHKYALNPLHFFGVASLAVILPSILMLAWFTGEQSLYWFGLGDSFKVQNRPLLALAMTTMMLGVFIFLTGFVCDFFLHHVIRTRINDIVDLMEERDDES